jgi:hypothetical protein
MIRVLLPLLAALAGCASPRVQHSCSFDSAAQLAEARTLMAGAPDPEQVAKARQLLLSSAKCGNPDAPIALAATFMTRQREDLVPAYGWLGVVAQRNLPDAAFAKHLMSEMEPQLSQIELNKANAAVAESLRHFDSER